MLMYKSLYDHGCALSLFLTLQMICTLIFALFCLFVEVFFTLDCKDILIYLD